MPNDIGCLDDSVLWDFDDELDLGGWVAAYARCRLAGLTASPARRARICKARNAKKIVLVGDPKQCLGP